jgi:hypothetical protein
MVLSDGTLARVTIAIPDAGVRLAGRLQALIRTTGRRSGKIRKTMVLYERNGDHYASEASGDQHERLVDLMDRRYHGF